MKIIKTITNVNKNVYLERRTINNDDFQATNKCIKVFNGSRKQKWLGFGGAFTEASCINLNKLSKELSKEVLNKYYSTDGASYNWIRVPIGSNDFCEDSFQYTFKEDLSDFNIKHDIDLVIPRIKQVLSINPNIKIVASPWSPPSFMKNNNSLYKGKLRKDYYDKYAEYLVKFIIEYSKNGINIDYLTMQNEPFAKMRWESCYFSLNEQRDFIYNYLIPKLEENKLKTKILVWDHNKEHLFKVAKNLIEKNDYIAGIAYHYYTGPHEKQVKFVRENYNDILMIHTEGCCGFSKYNENEWIRDAEIYIDDIIKDISNGGNAYIDWNIFLDEYGGPTYKNNYCKSPIILSDNNFILTPIYHYLRHISKFVEEGSDIISLENDIKNLLACASIKDNKINITVVNTNNKSVEVNIVDSNNNTINDTIEGHEMITCTYEE